MTHTPINQMVEFLAHTHEADIPESVIRRAGLILADTLGVMIWGATMPDVAALAQLYPTRQQGATVFGNWRKLDPLQAILLNATAAAAQELTEGNRFARGHLAVQVLPAILAQAEVSACRGIDMMCTFVLAYEFAARIGMASKRLYEVYGHGTWGVLGSAFACARLRGYDADQLREAIQNASTLSLAPLFETHFAGATVRNAFAGVGGMIGWTAADLAKAGYVGLESGIEQTFGQILGSGFDIDLFLDGLGKSYLLERNYFKFHACGRHVHPTLDALEAILADEPVSLDAVHAIEVKTYFPASRKKARQVRNSVDAKVSIPYAISSRLVTGTSGAEAYLPAVLCSEQVQRLMQRVTVVEDPSMTAAQPERRQACVRITLVNGRTLEGCCSTQPRGEFDEPLEPEALECKFLSLVSPQIGTEAARELWACLVSADKEEDVSALVRWIRHQVSPTQAPPSS
jgi:2-methylcitrate dehydratase PrpD